MLINLAGNLAFIIILLGLAAAGAGLIYTLLAQNPGGTLAILKWTLIGLGAYFGLMLAVSLASHEKVLGLNQEKKFCGGDCDLAFSVVNVTRATALGDPPRQQQARGVYYVVTVKVRSDAARVTMTPSDPVATVVDDQGNEYYSSPAGQQALGHGSDPPFAQALAPGASYTKDLVFDLPPEVKAPCLVVSEGGWVTRLVIGDENSPFHKKTKIRLDPPRAAASTKF